MAGTLETRIPQVGEETIEVTLLRFRWRSEDKHRGIAVASHHGEELAILGPIGRFGAGERLEVTGRFEEDPTHGRQFRVAYAVERGTPDEQGALAHLKTIPHVGEHRARELLGKFGLDDLYETIDRDPEAAFASVAGITPTRAAEAAEAWRERRSIAPLVETLGPLKLGRFAHEITRRYGSRATEVLGRDPYSLTSVPGIGFHSADAIATRVGVTDFAGRARAGVLHLLNEAESQGHTFLPRQVLAKRLNRLLCERVDVALGLAQDSVLVEDDRVYRVPTRRAERCVAGDLRALAFSPPALCQPTGKLDPRLTTEQRRGVLAAFTSRLSLITGGPGTGKTTLTRALVAAAEDAELRVALCAPSATAARVLSRATGHEAATLHRTLRWVPGQGPYYATGRPVPADIVVCDEGSTLPLSWMQQLLPAIDERTHLVFIGDADQLPPVGAGEPFRDLCAARICPVTRLTKVFRQRAIAGEARPNSMIVSAAHAVRAGRRPREFPREDERHDYRVRPVTGLEQGAAEVVRCVAEDIPSRYGLDPRRDVQVLSPVYRGELGVNALNARLREAINPDGERCCEGRFRIGDRLLQTHNDYKHFLFNGTRCVLLGRDPVRAELDLATDAGDRVALPYSHTAHLELGYAITVHKAQGGEIPAVVVVCHSSHSYMLSRELVYTAITRAARLCVVVGDEKGLAIALRRVGAGRRYSVLRERLLGEHGSARPLEAASGALAEAA
jgi:exodeoxyribonuclease V alpha subunit